MATSKYDEAEHFRKNKQFAEAAPIFKELWKAQPSRYIGWRFANCLRELGEPENALQIAREADHRFPDDNFIMGELISCLREAGQLDEAEHVAQRALTLYPEDKYIPKRLIWVLYDKKLKPAKKDSNLGLILQAADEIMCLRPDGLALKLVVQAVMKVAKYQNNAKWDVVLQWSDKVSAEVFDINPNEFGDKLGMSDRETYYISRSKALFKLHRYTQARQQAQTGLVDFPNSFYLRRLAALARVELDDVPGGTEEMRELLKHPRCGWYAKAELAQLEYRLGNHEAAYRLMCEALRATRQGDEFKIKYLVTLTRIALALQKPMIAAAYVQLAKVICINREWGIKRGLAQAEKEVESALANQDQQLPDLPIEERQLSNLCRKYWEDGVIEGFKQQEGVILEPLPEKSFTFVRPNDGSKKVFVHFRNLPDEWQSGMRVSFALKPSYDRKKDRESFEAIDVRILG